MPDLIPPGDTPILTEADAANQIAAVMRETYAALWPRTVIAYDSAAARDADLAGLSPTDSAFAWLRDKKQVTAWTGTAWVPIAGKMPRATATGGTSVSLGSGAWSGYGWTVTSSDTAVLAPVSGSVRAEIAGEVEVNATALFAASPTGQINVRVTKNGAVMRSNVSTSNRSVHVSCAFAVAATDVIAVQVFQNAGSARDVGGDASNMAFDVLWRGAA